MTNMLKIGLLIAVGIYVFVGLVIYLLQENLIFLSDELPADYTYSFDAPFQEHFITMDDGAEINALHFTREQSKGFILYFHGNAGNLARWGEIAIPFVDLGYEVFIIDYRGYGKSSGKRSQQKMLSDSESIYKYAQQMESEDRMILFGRSIGSAFASYLAGKNNASMLILETPFYSLQDAAKSLIPIYPTNALLKYNFKNYQYLETCEAPVYVFHGTNDEVVPYASGRQLAESLPADQVQFVPIGGGHHNDLALFSAYWEAMKKVLDK